MAATKLPLSYIAHRVLFYVQHGYTLNLVSFDIVKIDIVSNSIATQCRLFDTSSCPIFM